MNKSIRKPKKIGFGLVFVYKSKTELDRIGSTQK